VLIRSSFKRTEFIRSGNAEKEEGPLEIAQMQMIGVKKLVEQQKRKKAYPLKGMIHVAAHATTRESLVYLLASKELGATVVTVSDMPWANDDIVALAHKRGINMIASSEINGNPSLYQRSKQLLIEIIQEDFPDGKILTSDDGYEINQTIFKEHPEILERVIGSVEQTASGELELVKFQNESAMPFPVISNDRTLIKKWNDNARGTANATLTGLANIGLQILRCKVAVIGSGYVGRGIGEALSTAGGYVFYADCNINKLVELSPQVQITINQALAECQYVFTATGCIDAISAAAIVHHASDGVILGNVGHSYREIDISGLEQVAISHREITPHFDEFVIPPKVDEDQNRRIYILCKGGLVNFVLGGGNGPRSMDLTFTSMLLNLVYLAENHETLENTIHDVPHEVVRKTFSLIYPDSTGNVCQLSQRQLDYLGGHSLGGNLINSETYSHARI
jgi:adenosylhomocysteinase